MSDPIPRIAVVGVHGHGAVHVAAATRLERQGRAQLVGLVDPVDRPIGSAGSLPPILPSLGALLATASVDVVVIASPPHTHADLALEALSSGADVLLEKPPVTDLAQYERLVAAQRSAGRLVQVGFQSLGSHALRALEDAIRSGELGQITAIGASGSWMRTTGYWERAPWAGRRTLHGAAVGDGAVSNPFAHALMTTLRLARWDHRDAVGGITSDLRRANPIEADDTSSIRIDAGQVGPDGFTGRITCAFTLAGPGEDEPFVLVRGTLGEARLDYTVDRLRIGDAPAQLFGRDELLDDLLEARRGGSPLIAPLESTGGFVRVLDELATRPVTEIDPAFVDWVGSGRAARPVVEGVREVALRAVEQERVFREIADLPWA